MSAAPVLSLTTWEELVEVWENLDLPNAAWRAELIEGRIVMTPPPGNAHNLIADAVDGGLRAAVPKEWAVFQTSGIAIPQRRSLCVPDLVVIPKEDVPVGESSIPAEKARLVVEITSPDNADDGRKKKLWAYAHAGIPLYLLIDRFAAEGPSVVLYSEPSGGRYRNRHWVPFGEAIEIPGPFGFSLHTKEF